VILYFFTIPGHYLAHKMFKPFRASVGGRLRVAASAAGALPKYLDELFNSIGIKIVNAYGMTECAPGILSRTFGTNTFGTIGVPFDNVEVEIRRDDGSKTDIGENSIEHDKIYSVLMKEVSSLISREHGFKSFERISKILAVRNNFSIGKELTQTMKVKRKYIVDKYQSLIEKLHRDTRN
ncbi:MAG: AMP-binding protein, partial [Spirochaetales bacterium]|nr:AMP-binding protein [Spirochaetales bacterium]